MSSRGINEKVIQPCNREGILFWVPRRVKHFLPKIYTIKADFTPINGRILPCFDAGCTGLFSIVQMESIVIGPSHELLVCVSDCNLILVENTVILVEITELTAKVFMNLYGVCRF